MVWNILLILLVSIGLPVHSGAQSPTFKDKWVRVIVGFAPGGGSDAEGRVITRHQGKYIPGNPSLIVQNIPARAA